MKLFYSIALLLVAFAANAQELNCQVRVIAPNIQSTDPQVFNTLQQSLFEFMNNRKWTNGNYKPEERIECSILITVSQELGNDKFNSQITVQSNRPVLNSSYNSPMLYLVDKDFPFQYAQYQVLEFNENQFQSNLMSVLAFYAYVIIGLDEDSFAPKGGVAEFQKANSIVTTAQSDPSSGPGWKAFESTRNRYWLINNLTNSKIDYIHDVFYKYHRLGLDKMYESTDDGRKPISDALNIMSKLKDDAPNAMITQVFFQTKGDELVNIYSKATPQEKSAAVQILSTLDASNSSKYQQILKSN
ncbi:MAG: DUF4835 family protein [Chitinophagales bacterium]